MTREASKAKCKKCEYAFNCINGLYCGLHRKYVEYLNDNYHECKSDRVGRREGRGRNI